MLLAVSCRSPCVSLGWEIHPGAVWNRGRTHAAFIASRKAFYHPAGLARFPDGGRAVYVLQDMSLYVYDAGAGHLTMAAAFTPLAAWLTPSGANWKADIAFSDSLISCSLVPASGWDWYSENARTKKDSLRISALRDAYQGVFLYSLGPGALYGADSARAVHIRGSKSAGHKADLSELHNLLADVPLADRGLVIRDIASASDDELIRETIYLRNNSALARRAVVEQIISQKTKEEIRTILGKMDAFKERLEGIEKQRYEIYSKDTFERIRALL